ncbi:hypothetical protein DFR71_3679 [Nocardia alba]|uniref:Uncharacterized protein n=1 Tax=Nocardia alba TaxID=225051 RepID=A0A4V2PBI9_9NOCA|nr:hypothetical protein DFR71_3679 [Nocardia alba]
MLLDIVRLLLAWGAVVLIIAFWYWIMSNIGTF